MNRRNRPKDCRTDEPQWTSAPRPMPPPILDTLCGSSGTVSCHCRNQELERRLSLTTNANFRPKAELWGQSVRRKNAPKVLFGLNGAQGRDRCSAGIRWTDNLPGSNLTLCHITGDVIRPQSLIQTVCAYHLRVCLTRTTSTLSKTYSGSQSRCFETRPHLFI